MIEIISPGLQTTIQDLGRFGSMHYGISHSGVMDELSCKIANRLLGMADNNPVLECTQVGPSIKFHTEMTIAMAGAEMTFSLNGRPINNLQVVTVVAGDLLEFRAIQSGFRCYIAFDHKMVMAENLGSVSTHVAARIGGQTGEPLKGGQLIQFEKINKLANQYNASSYYFSGNYQIRFTKSPESALFDEQQHHQFQNITFSVSKDLNRMGIRLHSEQPITFEHYPIMNSRGLLPGAIQIPPDGTPIIAAKDAQTTGGYARIGQVITADLPIIGQLKPNDEIQFHLVTTTEAITIKDKQDQLIDQQ